ncbi:MaoC/PaaZ C-terminal domain-containing protein [Sphingobium estronivorans]|uniref:MaoC/PaaZ C-terminal domain-containing protein n=1 Tax=Sphingobium estronivorans TaxID=1577690 RepID=UPI001238CD3A|nr:MaoC/PaaZ C-terminal domain-containing protein [Sphingobium estronivorans]
MQDSLAAERPVAPVLSRSFPPISRHMLALYCGASGDHNPIHVDLDFARSAGFPDVFAHGMLVMAYLGLMLEEAGPAEGILEFSTRFVAITQLGAAITCEAYIRDMTHDRILLDLTAADECGDVKLQGRAVLNRQIWETRFGQA